MSLADDDYPDAPPTRQEAKDAVATLLRFIGDDPRRPGLLETPERVLRAWELEWGSGYRELPPEALVKLFEEEGRGHREGELALPPGGKKYNQMVGVVGIDLFSTCEHHMAPFFGQAFISYIPTEKGLLGISKLARVVEYFARRLQVQERLTEQVADFLFEHVSPDVGIVIKARHFCMCSRGVRQPHAQTITSALRGAFYDDPATRSEFLALAREGGSGLSCA